MQAIHFSSPTVFQQRYNLTGTGSKEDESLVDKGINILLAARIITECELCGHLSSFVFVFVALIITFFSKSVPRLQARRRTWTGGAQGDLVWGGERRSPPRRRGGVYVFNNISALTRIDFA